MTDDGHISEGRSTSGIERFFCIHCGYDLTGHSGDERRCPECGKTTTLEELRVVLAMRKGINAWEVPVVPSLLFLPTVFFGFPCVAIWMQDPTSWFVAMFALLFGVSAVAWCLALWTYRRKYANHYDWLVVLGESHLVAVQICLGGVFLGGTLLRLVFLGLDPTVLIVVLVSAAFVASSAWPYRDMKRRLVAYKLLEPLKISLRE